MIGIQSEKPTQPFMREDFAMLQTKNQGCEDAND
jgi:hypothetical protein